MGTVPAKAFQVVDYAATMPGGIGRSNPRDPDNYVPMNVYNMDVTNYVSTVRGTVSKTIEKNTDWEIFGKNVGSFLYETGMGIADSAFQVGTLGSGRDITRGANLKPESQIYNWGIKKDAPLGGGGRGGNSVASLGASSGASNNIIPSSGRIVNDGQAISNVELLASILAGNGMPQTSGGNAQPGISMTQGAMAPGLQPTSNVELLAEILARDGAQIVEVGQGDHNIAEMRQQEDDELTANDSSSIISERPMAMGLRAPVSHVLLSDEIESLRVDAKALEIDEAALRFNYGDQTGFIDDEEVISIRGDILPDPESKIARDRMSQRAVLAHEYYGHYLHHPSEYAIGDWRDEFRASYEAAVKAPNLTDEDRMLLMIDAYDRAKEAGEDIPYDETARRIIYGF